ncbi:MAG: 3-hydroxyacyl-CoA dehydrogenase NAD-binding domain-containing protein [Gammaproteobacteria bacterium]|nr:3-hydroxyacyl-CoA dehydrogenase NAD-binding domain-containing protein [Gammaproteobacteria bacterium]
MTSKHWTTETDDGGITWVRLDKTDGNANVLSSEVMLELDALLKPLEENPPQGVVFYSGKTSGFIMGADITEFTSVTTPERAYEVTRLGQQLFDRIEALHCPTVSAINGFCLGGGLELAMSTDYRVALANEKAILGLPEVQLGLHPGFGGTVRAIQICGVRPGMQLMLTGAPVTVDKGLRIGLIDRVASEQNWQQLCRELIAARRPKHRPPLLERILNLRLVRPFIKPMLVKQVAQKARRSHYPAPYAMIDLWVKHGAATATGYEAEARSFSNLMCTATSRNLVRVFFLQNRLKSQGNKSGTRIATVHVVGAGVMGGDIAAWCALRGLQVSLQDRAAEFIEPAMTRAAALFAKRVRDPAELAATTARLRADVNGSGMADADLIIEAIYENLEAKKKLYATVEEKMKTGAILATNTSSIRLQELRTDLRQPQRFIGLHFFNPVAQLPLVEVVRCDDSTQEVLDAAFAFVKAIGKFPLECASAPGFVVNRILAPYMAEAMRLVGAGVSLAAIDEVAVSFGMPVGPIELVDSVGLDVVLHVSKVLGTKMEGPVGEQVSAMVARGELGRKSGRGFYTWRDGKAQKDSTSGSAPPPDAEDRLVLSMVNEAVACLAEKVVSDADLLDAGVIFGTGFAPFRGGPINYARERGIDAVVARLRQLAAAHGQHFAPHPGWSELQAGD